MEDERGVQSVPLSLRVRWRRTAVGSASLVTVLVACSSVDCTTVGCGSEVSVDLSRWGASSGGALTATVCLDGGCRTGEVDPASNPYATLAVNASLGRRAVDEAVPLTVKVSDAAGTVVLDVSVDTKLDRFAPNGDRCGPVCYSALFRADEGRLVRLPENGSPAPST